MSTVQNVLKQGRGEKVSALHLASSRFPVMLAMVTLLVCGLAFLAGPVPHASAWSGVGYVYVLNNDLSGSNSITTFAREEDGSLTLLGVTSIGGLGSVAAFADGTQGSLILSHDEGTRLFAVDAGSNQISVINAHGGQLSLAGVFSSGGVGPISLTYRDGLLYVLNAANASASVANVVGFHVDEEGNLHQIAGATQPLSEAQPNPAQVQIDPSGHFLVVTEKLTNLIDVYRIHSDGSLSNATAFTSTGVYPFGMAFDPARPHELLINDALGTGSQGIKSTGAVTAYRLDEGNLNLINGPVPAFQLTPCWMVITGDGRFAYTSDSDSSTISGYRINGDGTISLLNANGITATAPSGTIPLEESLDRDSDFLTVLDSRLLLTPPGPATLNGYQIHQDGSLTSVLNPASITLPVTAIGLATE
jgi:6-phosphogluconolactonase